MSVDKCLVQLGLFQNRLIYRNEVFGKVFTERGSRKGFYINEGFINEGLNGVNRNEGLERGLTELGVWMGFTRNEDLERGLSELGVWMGFNRNGGSDGDNGNGKS